MRPGRLTVAQVAARFGCGHRTALRRLWQLHGEHGGLLERARGKGTKLWIIEKRLQELDPHWGTPTGANIANLHTRVDRAEMLAERALRRVGRLEAQSGD